MTVVVGGGKRDAEENVRKADANGSVRKAGWVKAIADVDPDRGGGCGAGGGGAGPMCRGVSSSERLGKMAMVAVSRL